MQPTCFPTPQGGNIVHALLKHFFLPISLSLSLILLIPTCFFYLDNIINMFHSCQSKKLKLTYTQALHTSYISRSRMGWGCGAKINVWECFSCKCVCREREGGRESETGTEDWMCECGSVCWRQTHKNSDKDNGRDSGGGATNGGELNSTLRASVSQSEPWTEISWFFTVSAAHYLGGEWGEERRVGGWEEMGVGV